MRARAFQGGDLYAFQCHIFSVRSAGVRQPGTALSCLPCLPAGAGAGASWRQLAGRMGPPRYRLHGLSCWDFTLPFSPRMIHMDSYGFIREEILVLPLRFFCPAEVFPFGLRSLTFRENAVLFLHGKSWGFPARPKERPLMPLLVRNKSSLFFTAEEQADFGSTALWEGGRVV